MEAVESEGRHLTVGVVGMKHIFRALSSAGRTDLALALLENPTAPSPTVWLKRGGTALWEDWKDGASRNHIMFGDFAAWAYQHLAGIRLAEGGTAAIPDPSEPGFRWFVLAPETVASLNRVSAKIETPYGPLRSAWRRENGFIVYSCTVPSGTPVLLTIAGRRIETLPPGNHVRRWKETVTAGWENANPARQELNPAKGCPCRSRHCEG